MGTDVKTVAVRLKAIHDDYKKGMGEASESTLATSKVVMGALAGVTAAASAMALKAADDTVAYGRSMMKLSRISGESTETVSKLAFAAQQSGVSADTLGNGIKFLEKNMAAANPEFAKLGVHVTDSSGKMRGAHDVLLDTADAIAHLSTAAERTDATLKIFGRAGLDLGPLLSKGRAGIIALENEAQKYGLVLSKDNVAAIQANIKAHRELDAAMLGAKVQIGEQVLPMLTRVTEVYARMPGPIASAVVPIAGVSAGLLAAATVAPQVVASVKLVAPAVQGMATSVTAGMTGMNAAISAGAAVGIALIIKGMRDIQAESEATQKRLSGSIDWTSYGKAAGGLNAEGEAVHRLGVEWNNMSAAEKLLNPGKWKVYNDLAAQQEEDAKHFAENTARITALGQALGVTGSRAQELADKAKVDLSAVDPATYIPIFRAFAAGQITAADATTQLTAAAAAQAGSSEDAARAVQDQKDAVKELNDAERASIDPQLAAVDARAKVNAGQEKVRSAERGLVDAHRAVADANEKVIQAEQRRTDASRKVADAVRAQREAQQALNELLRGPSADEQLNIESAQLSLEEARRRAMGVTTDDPNLEKRRNALEVRRAELELQRAQGAHGEAVKQAQKQVADASQAVVDARNAQADADRGVADARRGLEDASYKVAAAEEVLRQANVDTAKAALDLDLANRNLNLAYATGEVSIDQSIAALQRWVSQGLITQGQADSLAQSWRDAKAAADAYNPDTAPPSAPGVPMDPFFAPNAAADDAVLREWQRRNPGVMGPVSPAEARKWLVAHGHATGGMLGEGWNLVGEQGPELVNKAGPNAWVRTAPVTQGLLAPHVAAAIAAPFTPQGHGGYTHNGDIIVQTGGTRTARDIAWEQRKMALSQAGPS